MIDTVIIYGHVLSLSTKIPQSYFSKDADTMGILLVQTPCHGTIHGLTSGSWYTKSWIIGRVRYLSAHDLQSFVVYFAQLLCHCGSQHYFQVSEKSSCKLPDPRGPLSRLVPLSSIVSTYEKCRVCWKARSALRVGERDDTTPSSLPN